MRELNVAELRRRGRTGASVEDRGAVRRIVDAFVARLRCSNLRCRARDRIGFRRADDWVDWRAQKCGACGRARQILLVEFLAEVEVCAPAQVLRFRRASEDPAVEYPWEYAPFAGLESLG